MIAVPILMYHSISTQASSRFKTFAIHPAIFATQIAYLKDNGYSPLTVAQYATALKNYPTTPLPAKPVVITFDDGFADFYDSALPVLQKYQCPATLYVATGFIERTSEWLAVEHEKNRPMLSWHQLSEIAGAGIECGAHTHTHPHLDTMKPESARNEIKQSKEMLEQKLGRSVSTFAYPYGHQDQSVRQTVRRLGFVAACAVRNAMSHTDDDLFILARIKVSHDTDISRFAKLIAGEGVPLANPRESFLDQGWRWYRRLRQAYD